MLNDSRALGRRKVIRALWPFDRAGRHRIDPHPRPQFKRQSACQAEQSGLRGAIQRIALERALGVDIGDVDDAAAASFEMGRGGLGKKQRSPQIGTDQVVPGRRVDSADWCGKERGSIVHQCIEPAKATHDRLYQLRQRRQVQQVGGENGRSFGRLSRPCRIQRRCQCGRIGGRGTVVNRHAGPRCVQRTHDLGADATGGAGNQDNGSMRVMTHAGSIPARTRAAAAKPKLAVTVTDDP